MSQEKKYFGTDGIRNHVGQGLICPDQILKLGWATGKVMRSYGEKTVLIGKDTRISGYMFESALEAGFISSGIDVLLLGPMPTPAVAYLTRTFHADAGIVISASHNPHHDNGIKYFSSKGQKISDQIEFEVESAFDLPIEIVDSMLLGKARRIEDAAGRYIEFCKSTYEAEDRLEGYKIVLDCANGATYQVAPAVFQELGAEVVSIGVNPDGININAGCGATDLSALKAKVLSEGADLGIAFDGDGDRVMMVNHEGKTVDGDEILFVLASASEQPVEGVVGTVMSNLGLEVALKDLGVEFIRSDVGDRFVMESLKQRGWNLGAEPSGHVLCLDKTTTGDGIVAALQVMAILVKTGKSLQELTQGMKKFPQILHNVRVKDKSGLDKNLVMQAAIQASEKRMDGRGRVLLRASGTEPLIRVMIEGECQEMVESEVQALVRVVESEFS